MWELAPQNGFCCAVSFVLFAHTLSLCACVVTTTLRCDNSACPRQRTATCSTVPNARESTPSLPQSLHTVSGAGGLLPRETAVSHSMSVNLFAIQILLRATHAGPALRVCWADVWHTHTSASLSCSTATSKQQRLEDRKKIAHTLRGALALALCVLSLCSLCVSAKGFARRSGQGFRLRGVQPVSFTW